MVSDPGSPLPDDDPGERDAGISQGELYVVIRRAVEDAILDVVGTVLLVGLALVLVWFGVLVTISSYDASLVGTLGGIFVTLFGVYLAASSLRILPSVGDLV